MRIKELCVAPYEIERSPLELLAPVVGKLPDEPLLSLHDPARIKSDPLGFQSKLCGVAHGPVAVGRLDQRLARHASLENAEPTHFVTTLDDHRGKPERRGGAGGGVSPAPSADYHKIIFLHESNLRPKYGMWNSGNQEDAENGKNFRKDNRPVASCEIPPDHSHQIDFP